MAANLGIFFQTSKEIRGGRTIWVKDGNPSTRANVRSGNSIANPFVGPGRAFMGDLFEYRDDGPGYIFKTFQVVTASASDATSVVFNADGYSTNPEVGNLIIKSGNSATEIGLVGTITAVNYDSDTQKFTCTLDKAIGALSVGDVVVEAMLLDADTADISVDKVASSAPSTAAIGDKYLNTADGKVYTATATDTWGTGVAVDSGKYVFDKATSKSYTLVATTMTEVVSGTPLVKNPNTFLEQDVDFVPTVGFGLTNVNFMISPVYDKKAILSEMQPLPAYVLAKNRSYIPGVFWI
ncbi:MAG: hypothetical protein WCQ87_03095 [Parabacteroides sp.]